MTDPIDHERPHYDVRYHLDPGGRTGRVKLLNPEGRVTNAITIEKLGVCGILTDFQGFSAEDLQPMAVLTDKLLRPTERGGVGFLVLKTAVSDIAELADMLKVVGFQTGRTDRSSLYLPGVSKGI